MNYHVIAHTHWDREWHQTYQQYRVKLVAFMDELIHLLESSPSYTSFMLDGQTIVLEDYLEVKPEKAWQIEQLVAAGRLIIGPWYIQPDEFIPSGESLIRNLLIGQKIAGKFGQAMQIGYLPDSFGQAAQIPQILKGFGIQYALFWRGITDEEITETDFIWEGPDGSTVLATHLPLGYGNGRMLSGDLKQSLNVIKENDETLKEMITTSNMLLMCGFDQKSAIKELPEIVEKLNRHFAAHEEDISVNLGGLEDYFKSVEAEAGTLKTLQGEFRKGKTMRVHVSIASTRLDLKKDNFDVQNLYEKYLEPLSSMGLLLGNAYHNDMVNQGWKYLLQNQAHDSICTVCTDATHKEMSLRYEYAKQIGQTIQHDATHELIGKLNFDDEKGIPLVIVNTLGHKRTNLVETTVQLKAKEFAIFDSSGNEIAYQILDSKQENLNDKQIEIGVKNEDQFVWTTKIKFAAELNGFGYKTFYIVEGGRNRVESSFVYQDGIFTNDFFQAEIKPNGTLTVKEYSTGEVYSNLNLFKEGGNAGDEYDFSPPRKDRIITTENSVADIQVIHNGPIFATVKISHKLEFPLNTNSNERSTELKASAIDTFVTVNRHENWVDFKTVIDNTVKNHRIQAVFESGMNARTHLADQQFGAIRRENYLPQVEYWEKENWEEKYYPIYPQQKFVNLADEKRGLTIFNKGLPQYEILNAHEPDIALTLLCGTDYMGKQDLADRPGRRSGLHVETPDSILYGKHEMEYSLKVHAGEIGKDLTLTADEFTVPMLVIPVYGKQGAGVFADENSFLEIDGPELAISAVKKCETDEGLIVRVYNTTDQELTMAKVKLNPEFFSEIELVDFNENPLAYTDGRIQKKENEIIMSNLASNEIITFRLTI